MQKLSQTVHMKNELTCKFLCDLATVSEADESTDSVGVGLLRRRTFEGPALSDMVSFDLIS